MGILSAIESDSIISLEDHHVWCCAPTQTGDGHVHVLFSCWPKAVGFESWVTHSEIWHAEAETVHGPFVVSGPVFTGSGSGQWDGRVAHNPTLVKWGDAWLLYYMGTTGRDLPKDHTIGDPHWWEYRNNQRIGVAIARHPRGPWQRFERPLIDVESDGWVRFITSNPAVAVGPDGRWRMIFKTVEDGPMPFGGRVLHAVATSDSPLGPWQREPNPIFTAENVSFPVEDPCLWHSGGMWHSIVTDRCGTFTQAGRSWARFRSEDGVLWTPAFPPLAATLQLPWVDGRVEHVERLERPQVMLTQGAPALIAGAVKTMKGSYGFVARYCETA